MLYIFGGFYQQGRRVPLPEHQLVIVNVLDIPVDVDETKKADIAFWEEFDISNLTAHTGYTYRRGARKE